ncbi:MAG TPA: helical backbone metal receptor [Myxococcota bacterium]|nr:helical backbone metal receptor [Myxococcota bacterium]
MSLRADARRIVSLVPSLTEALFALGLGERVVGVTDWCVHPADAVAALPKLGGTKNPSLERIVELRPDLVIANHEENTRRDVERMRKAGLEVWVTDPRSVAGAVDLLGELAELGATAEARGAVIDPIWQALSRAAARANAPRTRVFCPIWKRPWMAVGHDTFADDLLRVCGGENVFGERPERRYPIVEESEISAAAPEVILLPDEPYAFGPRDAAELAHLPVPAARSGRIHCLDGTLVSWYGPRIARAIETLTPLLEPPTRS